MREDVKLILKFVFDARPHLNPLPRGEDLRIHAAVFSADRPANPAAGFAKDAARVAPSPWGEGRDEGGPANQTIL
jgi:hypothetical protein